MKRINNTKIPNYEDGKLQKLLENHYIKFTGAGVKASQINMDKIKTHDLFKKAGLKVIDYRGFKENNIEQIKKYIKHIDLPVFIKPNNGGSSVGMTMLNSISDLNPAIKLAYKYDDEIIIEKAVKNPREIEIAILGNSDLTVSNPGEILSNGKFYSYESKYIKPFKTSIKTNLHKNIIDKIKMMAKKAYKITDCRGYARIDFLTDEKNNIYINEINTLPGFTSISMFPKMMDAIGIKYKDLITKIIELGLEN